MRAELRQGKDAPAPVAPRAWDGRTVVTIASGVLTVAGFATHVSIDGGVAAAVLGSEGLGAAETVPLIVRLFYMGAVLSGAWFVLPKALYSLRRLRPDMNLLMTIAVLGAIGIGDWFEAVTVSFLFALSLALESWSVGRARRTVEALLKIAPESVGVVLPDGTSQATPAAQVPVGTIFRVLPGERVGLDGTVTHGTTEVNQAPITGESLPVTKEPCSAVFAGTINGNGLNEVRSTKIASGTILAHVIRLTAESQGRRAPAEQWVNRFAQIYTPAVLAVAILVATIPPLVFQQPWGNGSTRRWSCWSSAVPARW